MVEAVVVQAVQEQGLPVAVQVLAVLPGPVLVVRLEQPVEQAVLGVQLRPAPPTEKQEP